VWKNTLVVLLPDHGILYGGLTEADPLKNQIPMIWIGGVVKEPRRIDKVCNQTDFPATLLGQLGIDHSEYTFSRDVISTTYTKPFALNTFDDGISVYDSVSSVTYDFLSERLVTEKGPHAKQLLHRGKAILQAASIDLDKK
jgi:phosphoglycerol transferase MdoB-like AlkP superfamily enzyme